jgi:RimJ/RimL family protein N-acetyltransferase
LRAAGVLFDHVSEDAKQWLPESLATIQTTGDAISWLEEQEIEETDVLFAEDLDSSEVLGILIASARLEDTATNIHIGYLVATEFRGVGVATELVTGFLDWADKNLVTGSVFAGVDSRHTASIAVLEKAGFSRAGSNTGSKSMYEYEYRLLG